MEKLTLRQLFAQTCYPFIRMAFSESLIAIDGFFVIIKNIIVMICQRIKYKIQINSNNDITEKNGEVVA